MYESNHTYKKHGFSKRKLSILYESIHNIDESNHNHQDHVS